MALGQGRRASVQQAAKRFCTNADEVVVFAREVEKTMSKEHSGWAHDYAIIRLYWEFESLMLPTLVGTINNDPSTFSAHTGIIFPKHLTKPVCEFLVTGTGYFDFKGRSGLIRTLKQYVPDRHYLVQVVKELKYKLSLDRLSALRNFAAHNSSQSRSAAIEATGMQKLGSSGG